MSSLKNLHLLQNFRAMKQYCQANDIVLALDNNTLYEAKVLRVQNVGGTCKYFIHYQGWHRKYDTWVDESLIAKKDDVAKQSAITAGVPAGDKATKGKKGTASKEVSVKDEPVEQTDTKQPEPVVEPAAQTKSAGKRKADPQEQELLRKHRRRLLQMDLVDEDDDVYVAKLPIPPQLKKHLTDEWKIITSQDRLLKLPKAGDQTVEHVVMAFLDQRVPKLEKDKVQVGVRYDCGEERGLIVMLCTIRSQISAYRGLMEGLLVHFDKVGCFDVVAIVSSIRRTKE